MWFPNLHQVVIARNRSYLQSVFIGLTSPLLNLPLLAFACLIAPVISGVVHLIRGLIVVPILGIAGVLSTTDPADEQKPE